MTGASLPGKWVCPRCGRTRTFKVVGSGGTRCVTCFKKEAEDRG